MSKFILNAIKHTAFTEENQPLFFEVTFGDDLLPQMSEIARDLARCGWEVKTLRETLLPWDLNES